MSKTTYIKLDRAIADNWIWSERPFSKGQAWIDLLLMANHKDHKLAYKGEVITCKRGEVNRSILYLAERWGWSREKVRNFLQTLERDGMATTKATTHRTTITIENYNKYQNDYTTNTTTNRQQTDSKPTANRQQADTYKNEKNGKNEKKSFIVSFNNNNTTEKLSPEGQTKWKHLREKRGGRNGNSNGTNNSATQGL